MSLNAALASIHSFKCVTDAPIFNIFDRLEEGTWGSGWLQDTCNGSQAWAGNSALLVKAAVKGGVQWGDDVIAEVAPQLHMP